jgi:trk system potassium uptake protein TrkH
MIFMGGRIRSRRFADDVRVATTVRARRPRRRRRIGINVGDALNLVGSLLKPLGLAFVPPAAVAAGYGEPVLPFLGAGAITSAVGAGLEAVTPGRERVGTREAYLVVCVLWLAVAVLGSLPYLFGEPQLSNPVDAFFESMSGFSSTGASVVTDIPAMSPSFLLWRQFTAWIGGLGIIVLFLAVLPRLNVGGRQAMFKTEAAGPEIGFETTIREAARRFVTLYIAITAVEVAVLALLGWTGVDPRMTFFKAVANSMTTIATAGFTTEARSMEAFAPASQWVFVVFMAIAGTNFALLYAALVLRRPGGLRRDEEFRVYLGILVLAPALVLVGLLSSEVSQPAAFRTSVFSTVSMLTTTGFANADFNLWGPMTALLLFGLLMLGASAGSTSGSVKLVRHLVVAKMLAREIHHTVHPELIAPLRVNGVVIEERTLRSIIVFLFLYIGVWGAGATVIMLDCALRDIPLSAFEALADSGAALSGAGAGLGFAGPMGSFAPFSDISKLVLSIEMYLGRLEIVPVLVILARSYWRA